MYTFYIYNRTQILELLRTTSPRQLQQQLGADLTHDTRHMTLQEVLDAWDLRALGQMPLRDALLVDPMRGALFYGQLCATLALQRQSLQPLALANGAEVAAALDRLLLQSETEQPMPPLAWPAPVAALAVAGGPLAELAQRAEREGLTFGIERVDQLHPLALPTELAALLPPHPQASPKIAFEAPTGSRRMVSTMLVIIGILWLGAQLLLWESIAARPAGMPLALFTLALLVGVRARWPGYLGSSCIWLVANLPSFHYGTSLISWPTLSLLAAGLLLLACDRRIRAMWAWAALRLRNTQ